MNDEIFKNCIAVCRLLGKAFSDENVTEDVLPDPDFLAEFSFHHRLSSVLCTFLRDKEKYKKIFERAGKEIFHQLKNDAMQDKIGKILFDNNISYLFLKGNGFQRFYPDRIARTSNDIDLFVTEEGFDKALTLLKSIGFNESSHNDHEIGLEKSPSYYVELHSAMGGITKKQSLCLSKMAEKAFSLCDRRAMLSDSDFYIYTVYHLYKHFVFAGAGVRMLFDVYIVGQCKNLDRKYIEETLEEMELSEFEKKIISLNKALFETNEITLQQREIAEFIFESGAYGTQKNARALKYVSNEISGNTCTSAVISNFRLDFGSMKTRYRVLEKYPFLFPFCCVHRFVKGLVFKRKIFKKAVENDINAFKNDRARLKHIFEISGIF